MRGLTVALTVVTLILLGAGAGHAATLEWDFGSNLGNLEDAQKTYTVSSIGFIVMGYLSVTTTPPFAGYLYEKTDGSITGEGTGVGLAFNDPAAGEPGDHEVFAGQFLRVDLNDALLAGLSNFKIDLASIQAGEAYSLFTSNDPTAFSGGTACETGGTDPTLHPLCGGAPLRYIFLTGGGTNATDPSLSGDIDLTRITADTGGTAATPEPASLLLLGSGLTGVGVLGRRLRGRVPARARRA